MPGLGGSSSGGSSAPSVSQAGGGSDSGATEDISIVASPVAPVANQKGTADTRNQVEGTRQPSRLELLPGETKTLPGGTLTQYRYALKDAEGKPITGQGYNVTEHVTTVYKSESLAKNNINLNTSRHVPLDGRGIATDTVGLKVLPKNASGVVVNLQTFTIEHNKTQTPLSTVVRQEVRFNFTHVESNVTVITP